MRVAEFRRAPAAVAEPMVKSARRSWVGLLVMLSFAFVAFATLRPSDTIAQAPVLCVFCGSLGGVDFILNVILFVPLGMTVRWMTGRWFTTVITGIVTTFVIETMQWRLIPGRDAAVGDLMANTLGTLLGAWLGMAVFRWLSSEGRVARGYAWRFAVAGSLVVTASAFLLQPQIPRYPLWVQWTPLKANTGRFAGDLLNVDVKGRAVHVAERFRAHELFDTPKRSLSVRADLASAGVPPAQRQAIIVRTANGSEEGFLLAQWRDAAIFRSHIVAVRFKLRSILVGLNGSFSGEALANGSQPLVIEAESTPRDISVRAHSGEGRAVSVPRTVGLAWALIVPADVALHSGWLLVNSVWLAALVFPAAFFAVRSATTGDRASTTLASWPVLLFVLTVLVVPATGLSPLRSGEWAGVLVGVACGLMLERWTRRHLVAAMTSTRG